MNRERADYVKCWQEFEWLPGARESLALLALWNAPILIVTNQSAIGRGILEREVLDAMHAQMHAEAIACGGRIDHFLVCPHAPADQCSCRKPKPGLLLQAAAQYGLELPNCLMIGDSITDLLASEAAGCRSILLRSGRQGSALDAMLAALVNKPTVPIVDDLAAAASMLATAGVSLSRASSE